MVLSRWGVRELNIASVAQGNILQTKVWRMEWLKNKFVSLTLKRKQRRGVLTLEWILIVTVLVIGIIGGLGAVRNATVAELQDLAEAIEAMNVKTAAEIAAEP